jgi:uncharacterized protein YcbX
LVEFRRSLIRIIADLLGLRWSICDFPSLSPDDRLESLARVAWISTTPVKGLALVPRDEVLLEPFGVRENRRFHLIGEDGRLLNGKQLGPLVRIAADWSEDERRLTLRFPDGTTVADTVETDSTVTTSFYGREVPGHVVIGPWAATLSSFLGREVRLVQAERPGAGVDRGRGAVTLLSTASLAALGEAARSPEPVDPRRFRMLFGVEGVAAHEEDSWLGWNLRIGEATARVCGNVGRCIVTSRDPDTGERTLPTLDVIAEYRDRVQTTEPLPFGVWGEVLEPGRVRLGDPIELDD